MSVAAYLSELTAPLEDQLGERLAAAWLVGSGARGDFRPARSDIDVQAVSTNRLARWELERLAATLSHPALACPVRGLEFVLYAREDLADPRGPAFQLNLNTGPRMDQHVGYYPDAEPRFWFVLDVAMAQQDARTLRGLPPSDVLPYPSRPRVLASLGESLAWHLAHDGTSAVLGACRAWAWATRGQWLTKHDAAAWAAARLADPAPVASALAHRDDPGAPAPTEREVEEVVGRVERVLAAASPPSGRG